jgi:hypothetical protein
MPDPSLSIFDVNQSNPPVLPRSTGITIYRFLEGQIPLVLFVPHSFFCNIVDMPCDRGLLGHQRPEVRRIENKKPGSADCRRR